MHFQAKLLEEMDAVFGVGELVAEDLEYDKRKVYNARHLKGMRVEHDAEMFKEGKDIILTLKDQDVLDDEGDALVNVNFLDEERYNQVNMEILYILLILICIFIELFISE